MQLTGIGNRNYSVKPLIGEGAKGDEITEDMIANSKTLAFNLFFSKNISLKQKKYAPKVFLRRPFAGSLFEEISSHDQACSLLLTMATVTAYSDVLMVDMVGGLVTGAVAERLGGAGYVKEGEQDDYENINEMCVIKMLEPVMKKKAMFLTLIIKHSFEGI
ncbi:hypothetical protein Bca4012_007897 [Brassica carinata]